MQTEQTPLRRRRGKMSHEKPFTKDETEIWVV